MKDNQMNDKHAVSSNQIFDTIIEVGHMTALQLFCTVAGNNAWWSTNTLPPSFPPFHVTVPFPITWHVNVQHVTINT